MSFDPNMSLSPKTRMPTGRPMQDALDNALAFDTNRIRQLAITQSQAAELAAQEAGYGTIVIDDNGTSPGMRTSLLPPARAVASEFRKFRNEFDIALQPKLADITAVDQLDTEAEAQIRLRDNEKQAIENELAESTGYRTKDEHRQRSRERYDTFVNKHGNRSAVMFATMPLYWLLMAMVLVTECFINYHSFNQFWGVPAVAFGTTILLGVLLALAAHGHGEILKQWSFRFGPERDPMMRMTDWRMLGMSTAALAIVLGFTGWARWAAAASQIGSEAQASALGTLGMVEVHPIRDVMISLVANLGAWMVGVMLSYLAHDPDPDYTGATRQFRRADSAWNAARKAYVVRLKHNEAKHAKTIQEKTVAAQTRRRNVTAELDMVHQIATWSNAVQKELEAVVTANVEMYREALVRSALASKGEIRILKEGLDTPFSPFDYKAMRIPTGQLLAEAA